MLNPYCYLLVHSYIITTMYTVHSLRFLFTKFLLCISIGTCQNLEITAIERIEETEQQRSSLVGL